MPILMVHTPAVTVRRCDSCECDVQLAHDVFTDTEHPNAAAIVLTMGFNGNMRVWSDDFCEKLAAAGPYRVVRYDNRDVGLSTKMEHKGSHNVPMQLLPSWLWPVTPAYTLADMADDVVALMAHLGIHAFHAAGTSMGGMISQLVAMRHPDKVLSLSSLNSTTGALDLPGAALKTKFEFLKQPKSGGMDDIAEFRFGWIQNIGFAQSLMPMDEATEKYFRGNARGALEYSAYRAGAARQLTAILQAAPRDADLKSKVKCPTLVLHGDLDILIPLEHGRRTHACIPGSRFVVLKDAGHVLQPNTVDETVREIIATCKAAADK